MWGGETCRLKGNTDNENKLPQIHRLLLGAEKSEMNGRVMHTRSKTEMTF